MSTALIEAVLWFVITAVLLTTKTIDLDDVYIGWTIVVATISLISIYKDKEN